MLGYHRLTIALTHVRISHIAVLIRKRDMASRGLKGPVAKLVTHGALFRPDFERARIRTSESGDISPLTATGRNLPTEILWQIGRWLLGDAIATPSLFACV
jgi:hypothetical protein